MQQKALPVTKRLEVNMWVSRIAYQLDVNQRIMLSTLLCNTLEDYFQRISSVTFDYDFLENRLCEIFRGYFTLPEIREMLKLVVSRPSVIDHVKKNDVVLSTSEPVPDSESADPTSVPPMMSTTSSEAESESRSTQSGPASLAAANGQADSPTIGVMEQSVIGTAEITDNLTKSVEREKLTPAVEVVNRDWLIIYSSDKILLIFLPTLSHMEVIDNQLSMLSECPNSSKLTRLLHFCDNKEAIATMKEIYRQLPKDRRAPVTGIVWADIEEDDQAMELEVTLEVSSEVTRDLGQCITWTYDGEGEVRIFTCKNAKKCVRIKTDRDTALKIMRDKAAT